MRRTYEPHSVASIAERARTAETTARKHLKMLTEDGFVEAVSPPDERGTWYRRAPRSVVLERARQLLDTVDTEIDAAVITQADDAAKPDARTSSTRACRRHRGCRRRDR
ncbi:winged helix-turn-helix domain-containing protein [Salinirubrum litoreum]|uniref:Winged helix-turn-helix domain-containing protein n=2 Tax=Salinirubrum litoreum TaxID=1126234 RepID=A0ABD5RF38_9EURY